MVTAKVVKGLAERLERAEQLVAEGAVFPVAGLPGYAVVKNGDGTQFYFVCFESGHERCTCPDFEQRQKAAGLPCKHIMAAELALGSNPQQPAPASKVSPEAEAKVMGMLTGKRAA